MSYSENFNEVLDCIPVADEKEICWEELEKTQLGPLLRNMSRIEQNPEYHAEGDVYCHTKRVCEELIKMPEYRESSEKDKIILFLSALLHDIGKIRCTKIEDGKIVSPGHASKSTLMAREIPRIIPKMLPQALPFSIRKLPRKRTAGTQRSFHIS